MKRILVLAVLLLTLGLAAPAQARPQLGPAQVCFKFQGRVYCLVIQPGGFESPQPKGYTDGGGWLY